ncbi:MAG: glycosyltransferase N-terminal domain-containing protein [Planctomycetota bacterium]
MPNLRDLAYAVGVTLTSPIWGLSLLRTGKWRTDWKGRYGHAQTQAAHEGRTLLFNAVSVGEVSLLRGLIDELSERDPTLRIVIAATTNTGFQRATELYAEQHSVVRYPLDFSWVVSRFLDRIKPDAVCCVELEVWPNFVDACEKRSIPICVVNGRLSERSFKGYVKFKRLIGPSFAKLAFAAVQTEDYAERFKAMGVEDVHVLDTMKWDNAKLDEAVDGVTELAEELGLDLAKPVIVAGSTGPGEDKLLADALPDGAQLIIAPRKPEWFDDAAKAAESAGKDCVRRTDNKPGEGPVYLLDTIGELRRAYALADVVVVGRSFLGLYGSDVMEPTALGKPVIIGPNHSDFQDTVDAMYSAGGLIVTDDPGQHIRELLEDRNKAQQVAEAGRAVIRKRQGSTGRHADMILDMLGNASSDSTRD